VTGVFASGVVCAGMRTAPAAPDGTAPVSDELGG